MPSSSPATYRFPSACCGRRWRPSRPAWRTPASSASSTTTARSSTTPPTRPTADPTSANNCSRPRTSSPSPPCRSSGRPRPIRVWPCSPDEYAVATQPCRERTARPTPSPSPTILRSGRARRPASSRPRHGKRCNSEIAARQSKPTQGGWCSPTASDPCVRITSAILLDLDDPTRVLGRLRRPLLSPARDEQNGYVPNVVYSCGALVHADTLVIPYGIADGAIGIATAPLPQLLATIVQQPDRPR